MAEVQKSAFSLMSATLMLGDAFTDDVFSLQPALHSVGMVSQIAITQNSNINELMNGVEQVSVAARRTGVKSNITGNVFEMTAKNIMRAQSLAGSPIQVKRGHLTVAAAGSAASLTITSDPVPGEAASAIATLADIPSGAMLLLQRPGGETDYVFPTKSSAATTGTDPYTTAIAGAFAIPAGMSFPIGTLVWIVSAVGVDDMDAESLYCAKITGTLADYNRPVTYVAPKVRIVKGFQLSFNETQFTSMPWELQPVMLSATEVGSVTRGSEFGTRKAGLAYVGA